MTSPWLAVFGFLYAATIASAGVTPQTLIVTKPENAKNDDPTSTPTEPTTEGPLPPIKTLEMHVRANVTLRYSRTSVTTVVKNPAKRAQETAFRMLLPESAFITGFIMIIDNKEYPAYVKEKEEAKKIYNEAVSQGIAAAQVATKARDSNHFAVSMNVEGNSNITFKLTYEELLARRNDMYNLAINLLPANFVPNLTVTVHVKEPQKISILQVPEISTGNEIIPTENYVENQKAEITRSPNGQEVTVVFRPDLKEQKILNEVYAQKTKESLESSNSFGSYLSNDEGASATEGALGQFVVQYAVDKSDSPNQVIVDGGYFVHFYAPSDLTPLNKFVTFVLDLSGSMGGRKIEQLREAMQTILGELREGDYFSLVLFESSVTVQDLNNTEPRPQYYHLYGQEELTPTLLPPYPATPENIAKAKEIVSKLQAGGGTNIADGLDIAVKLVQRGISNKTIPALLASNKTSSDVDKKTIDENEPEPIIIFLTDGEPTIGETDPTRIINSVTEKNYGQRKATIFSLGFGDYADRTFLRTLSLRNDGFSRVIYEASDSTLQLRYFYKEISSPLLAGVKFIYPPKQVEQDSLTRRTFRTFFAGSELIVAGRLVDQSAPQLLPTVHGFCGTGGGIGRVPYENNPVVIINTNKEKDEYLPLERLWAYLTIKQLLDEHDAEKDQDKLNGEKSEAEKKALKLALQYSFVTKLTSLVVVKPNATDAVNAESVDKGMGIGGGGYPGGSYNSIPLSVAYGGPASASGFGGSFGQIGLSAPAAPPPLNAKPGGFFYPAAASFSRPPGAPGGPSFDSFGQPGLFGGSSDLITTPVPNIPIYATRPPNPAALYQLEHFLWVQPLLNYSSDELILQVNGTAVYLKLTKNVDEPQRLGEAPCSNGIDGVAGSCVYLSRCEAAQNITADIYASTYCLLDKYAGVCCPEGRISA